LKKSIFLLILFLTHLNASALDSLTNSDNGKEREKKLIQSLHLSNNIFKPINIFGSVYDRIENIEGVYYLSSKTSTPSDRWEIVLGSPKLDLLIGAKSAIDFIDALSAAGNQNNLAVGWSRSTLIESLNADPKQACDVNIRRIYVDGNHLYTLLMKVILRKVAIENPSPDLVTISKMDLQRYDSTVIERMSQ
jgi:hypothetical protein